MNDPSDIEVSYEEAKSTISNSRSDSKKKSSKSKRSLDNPGNKSPKATKKKNQKRLDAKISTPAISKDDTAGWAYIKKISFKFQKHCNPLYAEVHKLLNTTYGTPIRDLDSLFVDGVERTMIQPNAARALRESVALKMTPLATATSDKSRISSLLDRMPLFAKLSGESKDDTEIAHIQDGDDLLDVFRHARASGSNRITVYLDIDALYFKLSTNPTDFFNPKRLEDVSEIPFDEDEAASLTRPTVAKALLPNDEDIEPSETSPGSESAVSIPLGMETEPAEVEASDNADVLYGCCCDFRRAAILSGILYVVAAPIFWLYLIYIQDYEVSFSNPFYLSMVVQTCVSIFFAIVGLVGAFRFNGCMVLATAIWLFIDFVWLLIVYKGGLRFYSAILRTYFGYSYVGLYVALHKGLLTRENYKTTSHCCSR